MRLIYLYVCTLVLIALMVSCEGNQSVNNFDNQKKTDSKEHENCDTVNDTIYLNFHSNMNEDEFNLELKRNLNLDNEKVIFHFKDKYSIPFNITPIFNECLTAARLEAHVQFGNSKKNDDEELEFYNYLKNELESKYGHFILTGDSTYHEPSVRNETYFNTPYWVKKFTYPHWDWTKLLEKGEKLRVPESGPGSTYGNGEINTASEGREVEELISATYNSYANENKSVEIIIVKSKYSHQTQINDPKIATSGVYVQINYYSKKYWKLLKDQLRKNNQRKLTKILISDSLDKANKAKL